MLCFLVSIDKWLELLEMTQIMFGFGHPPSAILSYKVLIVVLCLFSVFRMVQQQVVEGRQDVWPVVGEYTVLRQHRLRRRDVGQNPRARG